MCIARKIARPIFLRQTPLVLAIGLGLTSFLTSLVRAQTPLKLLGRTVVPLNFPVDKTKVGGLSGLSYDPATKTFWAVSDDSSYQGGPPRIYQLRLSPDGKKATFLRVLPLRDETGKLFPVADCEGIACTGKGGIWVSSEGVGAAMPWVRLFDQKTGRTLRNLPLPAVYFPTDAAGHRVSIGAASQVSGIVSNRAFESCTVSPDRHTLYTANEASLVQDKAPGEGRLAAASLFNHTRVRISALDARTGECFAQKLYVSDAGCLFGSISEMFSLDNAGHLLVLERRLIAPYEDTGAYDIRIYQVDLRQPDADDLRKIPALIGLDPVPLRKKLIFDSENQGLTDLDNVEGICLAPAPGGGQILVGISDNNFSLKQQTQILIFCYP